MFSVIFRGFIFIMFMFWYSVGLWEMINDYFGESFRNYLKEEFESNKFKRPSLMVKSAIKYNTMNTDISLNSNKKDTLNFKAVCMLDNYLDDVLSKNILTTCIIQYIL